MHEQQPPFVPEVTSAIDAKYFEGAAGEAQIDMNHLEQLEDSESGGRGRRYVTDVTSSESPERALSRRRVEGGIPSALTLEKATAKAPASPGADTDEFDSFNTVVGLLGLNINTLGRCASVPPGVLGKDLR